MMYLTVWFLFTCILSSTSALEDEFFLREDSSRYDGKNTKLTCEFPFHSVGGFCFFVDNLALGTWDDASGFCQALGGDLVDFKDANKLYEIVVYLKENDLEDVSYWVGANNINSKGNWTWVSDSSPVKMGTPLWGDLYGDQPNGGSEENCAILSRPDFYYMHDDICDFPSNGVICQSGGTSELSFKQPKECPPDFIVIGNTCLNILTPAELNETWHDAKAHCEVLGGHLVKIDDANFFSLIYDHLAENNIKSAFHIDGNDEMEEGMWLFHDGSQVKMGTPFWDVTRTDLQEPQGGNGENCIYIEYSDSYYFRDAPCDNVNGLICQYNA